MKNFYSNGKILLSGEYLVYYGAKAIGLPIKMGQNLIVTDRDDKLIDWTSYNNDKKILFKCILNESFKVINTNDNSVAKRLQIIIKYGHQFMNYTAAFLSLFRCSLWH